jgi:formate C-acetyltransferase
MPKCLELALHNGLDPMTEKQLGPKSGELNQFGSFEKVFSAYHAQFKHFLEIKLRGNRLIERMYATLMPAPFLSVLIDDCIARGRDYNAGGARYNNTYIQFVGLGTLTDSLSALRQFCFTHSVSSEANGTTTDSRTTPAATAGFKVPLAGLIAALDADFASEEPLRQRLVNKTHKYGNDDDAADELMIRVFNTCVEELDGRPDARGGHYRVEMLPTTCHVYFGSVTGATPDGRHAHRPLSEGISPVQGADRQGPTAVIKSAAKLDHLKAGGTLLNMKLAPGLIESESGLEKWAHLVRSYFKMDGHHIQFNVVRAETLREALADPEEHRDLIVRVAGYSDYFCDLSRELQEEIIQRTEHAAMG